MDATRRMLTDRIKTVAQTVDQASKDRLQIEKRERDEAIHRRSVKDRMELDRHLDRQHTALKMEMKEYVESHINKIISQDDCCNWHHSACKNYHGMRRMPRESTPKTNLYRSKSDETLSSLGLSSQQTHRVSRTQAQAMKELRKKSQKEGAHDSQGMRVHPQREAPQFKSSGRSPEGCSNHSDGDEENRPVPGWVKPADTLPFVTRRGQPIFSPLASVPESNMNTFSDSSLQHNNTGTTTDDSSLAVPYSSPVYAMDGMQNNLNVYHSKTDSGSNPDSGYSNSLRSVKHKPSEDQHNTSMMTNESCNTDGSGSSFRSSMSADKSADAIPATRQYFSTVSNQMELWYERRLREMEKVADDRTKQQSEAMQSRMQHLEDRMAINRIKMNASVESATGTEV